MTTLKTKPETIPSILEEGCKIPVTKNRTVKVILSWIGTPFCGFQKQREGFSTVQSTLEDAWRILCKEEVQFDGCSRLDSGVHASEFVASVRTDTVFEGKRIVNGLNGILRRNFNAPIRIYSCIDMDSSFHARFSSIGKHYIYRLWFGSKEHALITPSTWHLKHISSSSRLSEIICLFEGTHDFSSFRSKDCAALSTKRKIHSIFCEEDKEYPELITVHFQGNGFLKNMIRNLIGTSIDCLTGKLSQNELKDALYNQKNIIIRRAPAHALTLKKVFYPSDNFPNTNGLHSSHKEGRFSI